MIVLTKNTVRFKINNWD